MKNIKKNLNCLNYLSTCKPDVRNAIITHADSDTIDALCECVLNVLNGTVKIDANILKRVKKHKEFFR